MPATPEPESPRTGFAHRPAPALSEVFSPRAEDGAAAGFVAAMLRRGGRKGPALWLQDRLSAREAGRPYRLRLPGGLLTMELSGARDTLVAAEEGLRCAGLSAVVAEIWGDPPALGFTATKRLALRAEASGLPCWLIRRAARPDLSAARDRWRVASLPSAPNPDDPAAPGAPRWRLELFRSRGGRPGIWTAIWTARHDRATDRLDLAPWLPDGALADAGGAARRDAAG